MPIQAENRELAVFLQILCIYKRISPFRKTVFAGRTSGIAKRRKKKSLSAPQLAADRLQLLNLPDKPGVRGFNALRPVNDGFPLCEEPGYRE